MKTFLALTTGLLLGAIIGMGYEQNEYVENKEWRDYMIKKADKADKLKEEQATEQEA